MLRQLFEGGTPNPVDVELQGPDQNTLHYRIAASPVKTPAGKGISAQLHLVDITDLVEKQHHFERLAHAFERTNDSIVVTDSAGNIQLVNPAFSSISGYSEEETIGKKPHVFLNLPDDIEFTKGVIDALQDRNTWKGRLHLRKKNGGSLEIHTCISPVAGDSGEIKHFVSISEDLTRQRDLERQLEESQRLEALGTLANGIAHRFNNLLASIMGQTELIMLYGRENSAVLDRCKKILDASERGKEFVSQLKTFSSKSEPRRRPVNVAPIVRQSLKFIDAVRPSSVNVICDLPDSVPDIMAVSSDIHQLLLNLFSNAIVAMEGVGGRLAVAMKASERVLQDPAEGTSKAPQTCIVITVTDTGRGIPEEIRHRVFEPFFTTRNMAESSGMGLTLAHGIVQQHGGTINFRSEINKGTEFELVFPVIERNQEARRQHVLERNRGNSERILLVDDEEYIVEAGRDLLVELGYQVTTDTDPLSALHRVLQGGEQYDLIITDLSMPGISGYELAAKLAESKDSPPVILCSGMNESIDRNSAQLKNVAHVLKKPCSYEDMSAVVRRVLDHAL